MSTAGGRNKRLRVPDHVKYFRLLRVTCKLKETSIIQWRLIVHVAA